MHKIDIPAEILSKPGKLSKLHASLPYSQLRTSRSPEEILGAIAHVAGLLDAPRPCRTDELVLDWSRVPTADTTFAI